MCCKYNNACHDSADAIASELLRVNDTANDTNTPHYVMHKDSEVDENIISNHSSSINNSSKLKEKDKGLLSALVLAAKDSSSTEQKNKFNRERRSLKWNVPVFGNMKLTSAFKGAAVQGASIPGSSSTAKK